jgi:HEAT repeats
VTNLRHAVAALKPGTWPLLLALSLFLVVSHALPDSGAPPTKTESGLGTQASADAPHSTPGPKAGEGTAQLGLVTANDPKPKDWWDKASVISQFFAGVVIAVVGLLITYTIQRTQIRTSQETARAEIESAEVRAKEDRRLQQGQLTAQLVEHLTSESEAVREIAIVALRESVPEEIYDAVAVVLARADDSAPVRKTAIQQLGRSSGTRVAQTLGEIATDPERPEAERYLAFGSAS